MTDKRRKFKKIVEWNIDWLGMGITLLTFGLILFAGILIILMKEENLVLSVSVGIILTGLFFVWMSKGDSYYVEELKGARK
jgi:uncharacterized BrkB/YihY/UPF0761 family membrane protein